MKKLAILLALSLPVLFTACNTKINIGDLFGGATVTAPGSNGTLDTEELFGTIGSSTVKPQPYGKFFAEGDYAITVTTPEPLVISIPADAFENGAVVVSDAAAVLDFLGVPSFMTNSDATYQLSDACIILEVKDGLNSGVVSSFTLTNTDSGTSVGGEFTLPAGTDKVDFTFSSNGGFTDDDVVLSTLASALSPLPASVKVHDLKFADHESKGMTKAEGGNIEITPSIIVPLAFKKGSKFVVSSTLGNLGIKVDPAQLKGFGLKKVSAPATLVNTTPFDFTIASAGAATVSFPTIKAGSLDNPTTTTGTITVDNSNGDLYENIGNISVTVTATAAEDVSQLNKNQNVKVTCENYSVTVSK